MHVPQILGKLETLGLLRDNPGTPPPTITNTTAAVV